MARFFVVSSLPSSPSANVGTSGGYPVYQDRATFYEALSVFTAEEANSRFLRDIVYSTEDSSVIEVS